MNFILFNEGKRLSQKPREFNPTIGPLVNLYGFGPDKLKATLIMKIF